MYKAKQQQIKRIKTLFDVSLTASLLLLIVLHIVFALKPGVSPKQWWWTNEQRAAQHWQRAEYLQAAELLGGTRPASIAYYAAEDFAKAEALLLKEYDELAYFALANSLAHQERYDEAIIAYRMALVLQPKWPEVEHNLQLVKVLQEKPRQRRDKDQDSKSDFAADDISFDLDKDSSDQQVDDALASGDLSETALRQLWLRQLNRKPVDFLQRKFAYQWHQQQLKEHAGDKQ
ncbi:tetratricopeptide repeat protein [uncultured Pseudoteredinibacter sp.]|uniref:tetratricopeptide repeat protein n=1 Tax=uncultured Pseudoteredinibacter sp. TaxID=1641701 RepID=UPI002608A250|nr:tetratricopeptide repeat protein [uncultured Pseudoteredinibacter sp.]